VEKKRSKKTKKRHTTTRVRRASDAR
jgi:hypothetical protein